MTKHGYLLTRGTIDDLAKLGLTPETAVGRRFVFNGGGDANEGELMSEIMSEGTIIRHPDFGFLLECDVQIYWRPILRPSTPADLPALHRVWRRSVEATHDFLAPEHLETLSEVVRDFYLPTTIFLLATDVNDQPVGFLGGEDGTIEALFVDPDWFGKGVGRVLMDEALKRAPVVKLDVNEQNAKARRFYERLGFVVVGRSETDGAGLPYPLLHLERRG